MYEKFTDRARKTMQLANQEAQRFNHEYISTEHILLGLVKDAGGVAAKAIEAMGIDLRKVRLEVEKLIHFGPEMVTIGKLPQTPKAKRVIEQAMEAARSDVSGYVGTEHLLLGLLAVSDSVACDVMTKLGVTEEKVRKFAAELPLAINESVTFNFQIKEPDPVCKQYALYYVHSDGTGSGVFNRLFSETEKVWLEKLLSDVSADKTVTFVEMNR